MVEILGLPQVDRTGEGRKEEETLIEPQIEKHFQNKQQWPTTEICKPSSTFTRSPCKSTQKRQRPNTNVKRVQNQLKCSSCKQWWEEKPNLLEGHFLKQYLIPRQAYWKCGFRVWLPPNSPPAYIASSPIQWLHWHFWLPITHRPACDTRNVSVIAGDLIPYNWVIDVRDLSNCKITDHIKLLITNMVRPVYIILHWSCKCFTNNP